MKASLVLKSEVRHEAHVCQSQHAEHSIQVGAGESGSSADFIPTYSGGTAPDLNRLPF
jgi:hypothetical protein